MQRRTPKIETQRNSKTLDYPGSGTGFIQNDAPNQDDDLQNVIDLVHSLGNIVVAVGVERVDEPQALQRMGCEIGQGFLFGQPMPHDMLLALIEERARSGPKAQLSAADMVY